MESSNDIEALWAALLSENPGQIRRAWGDLTDDEARAVVAQLKKMADDEEYAADARRAAGIALEAIREAG